ncbi:MAG: tetratricopeptide repeat protein, partial [Candidatus Wallbacteria bacterium]|nr:tetratricopeptide repeat protein [Candidatus Wallbacteria bacterium]
PQNVFAAKARQRELDILDRMHDFPGLVSALEAALAADPQPDSSHIKDLALAHVRSGHPEKAIELLEKYPISRNLGLLASILKDAGLLASYLGEREKGFDGNLERARILGTMFLVAQDFKRAKLYLEKAPPVEETLAKLVEVSKALKDLPGQIALYEKLIALAPAKGPNYEKLGELYLAQGDVARAQATWRKLLTTQGTSPESHAWLARVLLDHAFKKEALDVLFQGRRALADPNLFRKETAECQTALGNFEAACQEYLEMAPGNFEAVREPLVALARSSDAAYKGCAARLQAAVLVSPRLPEYYFLADEVLRIRGFGPEVQSLVDHLCDAFRPIPRELLGYGVEFEASARHDEALRVFDYLTRTAADSDLWDTYLAQAAALRASGNPTAGLASLDKLKATKAGPGFVTRGEALRGQILLDDLRRYADARIVLEALAAANPASPDRPVWLLSSARAALGTLDYASARRVLEGLVEVPRNDVRFQAIFLLGYLARLEGRLEEAMERFTSITMEDTGNATANDALEGILFLTTHPVGKDEQPFVRAYFQLSHYLDLGLMDRYTQTAASLDPNKIPASLADEFLFLQGQAQRAQGKAEDAAKSFELLVQKFADSARAPQAMLALADLYEKALKSPAKASKWLKDYLIAYPSSLQLDEVRGRIQKLDNPKS